MSSKFLEILDTKQEPTSTQNNVRLEDVLADHEASQYRTRLSTDSRGSSDKPRSPSETSSSSNSDAKDSNSPTSPLKRLRKFTLSGRT